MKQNKKLVWITGASSGIGKELCYKFSQENWDIALTARRKDKLVKITKEIGSNNTICPANVADKSEVEQAFNKLLKSHNKIDLAILNAGIYKSVSCKNFNSKIFKDHIEINYMGVVNSLEKIIPKMIQQGYGHIAILTSPTGWRGLPKAAAYGPTKSALKNLAESLKFELEPLGIKIQLFCPGFVETEATPVGEHSLPGIISARKAANLIFNSLKSNYFEVFIPNNFVIWCLYILKFLPEKLAHRLIKWRTGY
tara:strand:+ start:320 stop:1078 length:759 start_codon:yes stop_codon:yes gene_type:complete